MRSRTRIALAGALLMALAAAGIWQAVRHRRALVPVRARPPHVMGTGYRGCELVLVVPRRHAARAAEALERAVGRLRRVESLMSVYLADSQIGRLNAAKEGEHVSLDRQVRQLLLASRRLARQSDGAFDVTCLPLGRLWRRCAAQEREPTAKQIAAAEKLQGLDHLVIYADGATKKVAGVQVDLGGLAKGYGVDEAVAILKDVGDAVGGMVNIGGDLRCFGGIDPGRGWPVSIRHPFKQGNCGVLLLTDAAVATSGDYYRYFEIAGRRYSHIFDPRTGRPAESTHSVTVVSLPTQGRQPSAAEADAWATALSVLGPAGLEKLKSIPGLEAMIVTGAPTDCQVHMTAGFAALLAAPGKIELD